MDNDPDLNTDTYLILILMDPVTC